MDWLSPERAETAIRVAWLAFVVFWIWKWRSSKPTERRESVVSRLSYSLLMMFGFALIFGRFAGSRIVPVTPELLAVAVILCWGGVAFAIWARVWLGTNWSAVVTVKAGHELVCTGPYRLVRHPIYTGLLAATAGVALEADRWQALIGLALVFLSLWIKIRKEERMMLERFGDAYREYQRRTSALIPGLV